MSEPKWFLTKEDKYEYERQIKDSQSLTSKPGGFIKTGEILKDEIYTPSPLDKRKIFAFEPKGE